MFICIVIGTQMNPITHECDASFKYLSALTKTLIHLCLVSDKQRQGSTLTFFLFVPALSRILVPIVPGQKPLSQIVFVFLSLAFI